MPESAGQTRWRRAGDVLWRRSLDSVLVLRADLPDASPTAIGGGGVGVWELLETTPTTDELVAGLADGYRTDEQVVSGDVVALLDELRELGLVEQVD